MPFEMGVGCCLGEVSEYWLVAKVSVVSETC